jgi:hypothetical protein
VVPSSAEVWAPNDTGLSPDRFSFGVGASAGLLCCASETFPSQHRRMTGANVIRTLTHHAQARDRWNLAGGAV